MTAPLAFHHPTGRSIAILCIDDEPPTLAARTAQLEAAGYRVFPALSADSAVHLFVTHQVDLILSTMVVLGPHRELGEKFYYAAALQSQGSLYRLQEIMVEGKI